MNQKKWGFKQSVFVFGIGLFVFILALIMILANSSSLPVWLKTVVLPTIIALSLLFVFLYSRLRNLEKVDQKKNFKDLLDISLEYLKSEQETVEILIKQMEGIIDIEKNTALSGEFASLRIKMSEISKSVCKFEDYLKDWDPSHHFDARAHFQEFEKVNKSCKDSKKEILELFDEFSVLYTKNRAAFHDMSEKMTTLIYYLGVSIPIMSDFTQIFNEFSKELILEVINKFGDITKSSHQIASDIEDSMSSLMDETKQDSLAFIIKKAHNLVLDFESFYQNMENLKDSSNNFAEKSAEKLHNIQDIADSIEQIAETIKVLSLNVSIEAANTGNAGKGFQVLARDLREFTTKTMRFAHEVKNRVKDALQTTDGLRNDYVESMGSVYSYMNEIKTSIHSFEGIIRNSFEKIKKIITDLKRFSSHIDSGIKEVVGKLQYYDITSQEVDHLGLFVEKIFMDLFNSKMLNTNVSDYLSDEQKAFVKKDVLRIISEIITTANERKILNKYEEAFGVKLREDISIENKASHDIKGENDSIILF